MPLTGLSDSWMLCAFPIELRAGLHVPCNQCMNCRINRRRLWTGRMLAEAAFEPNASFWTLTYADEYVPVVSSGPFAGSLTLSPRDLTLFLKRYRKQNPQESLRYFAVGEYGEEGTFRPHLHVVAYGPRLDVGLLERVGKAWSQEGELMGRVTAEPLLPQRAAYCAGYSVKKMTGVEDHRLLPGQVPEFVRMSRKPPLGHRLINRLCGQSFWESEPNWAQPVVYTRSGAIKMASEGDVPKEFRYQGTRYPIGRYWISKMREVLDVEPKKQSAADEPDYEERLAKAKEKEAQLRRRFRDKTRGPRSGLSSAQEACLRAEIIDFKEVKE